MEDRNQLPPELEALAGARSYTHGFLPLAAAYCRHLGIVELVNTLVPSKMNVSPGLVVQAMVLDTLSGRSPLYRVEEFLNEPKNQNHRTLHLATVRTNVQILNNS